MYCQSLELVSFGVHAVLWNRVDTFAGQLFRLKRCFRQFGRTKLSNKHRGEKQGRTITIGTIAAIAYWLVGSVAFACRSPYGNIVLPLQTCSGLLFKDWHIGDREIGYGQQILSTF